MATFDDLYLEAEAEVKAAPALEGVVFPKPATQPETPKSVSFDDLLSEVQSTVMVPGQLQASHSRFGESREAAYLPADGSERIPPPLPGDPVSRPGLAGRATDLGYDVVAGISNLGKYASAQARWPVIMSDPYGEAEKILAGERSLVSQFRDKAAATANEQFAQSREQREDVGKRMVSNAIRSGVPSTVMTLGAAAATRGRGKAATAIGSGATAAVQAADAMVDRFEENVRNQVEPSTALADAILTFGAEFGAEFVGNYLQIKSLNGILNPSAVAKLSKIKDLLGKRNPVSTSEAERMLAELGPFKTWFQKSLLPTVAKSLGIAGTEGAEEGVTEVAERGASMVTGAPRQSQPILEVMGTGALAGGGMAAIHIPAEIKQNKKLMAVLADENADKTTRAQVVEMVAAEMEDRGLEREAAVLRPTWFAAIDAGKPIDLDTAGQAQGPEQRGVLRSPSTLAARTAEIRANEDAMRTQTPAKITGSPRVASTSTADLTSFLQQHAPAVYPEELALVPKTELKPYQVKAQEEDAAAGLVTVFYRGAKGEELAAVSGGPGVSFVPADLDAGETMFKTRHEKAHALDARPEMDPLTDETRARIAQAVTGPDYARHAQDLEVRRVAAELPQATPSQEFDELAADVRAQLYGAKGKTAEAQRSSLNGWINQVAETEPGRFQRLKETLVTYVRKVGIPVTLPDRTRGTAEQWGAVADAAVAELNAAKTIPQRAARQALLNVLGQIPGVGTPNAPGGQQKVKDVTVPAPSLGQKEAGKRRLFTRGKTYTGDVADFAVGEIVRHSSDGEEYRVVEKVTEGYVRVQRGNGFPLLVPTDNLVRTTSRPAGATTGKPKQRLDLEDRARDLGISNPGILSDKELGLEIAQAIKDRKAAPAPESPRQGPIRPRSTQTPAQGMDRGENGRPGGTEAPKSLPSRTISIPRRLFRRADGAGIMQGRPGVIVGGAPGGREWTPARGDTYWDPSGKKPGFRTRPNHPAFIQDQAVPVDVSSKKFRDDLHGILTSPGFGDLLREFGIWPKFTVAVELGSYNGKLEPSFNLNGLDMDEANTVSALLGFAFDQDEVITYQPAAGVDEDGITMAVFRGDFSEGEAQARAAKAFQDAGLDFTMSGKEAVTLYFGDEAGEPSFFDSAEAIAKDLGVVLSSATGRSDLHGRASYLETLGIARSQASASRRPVLLARAFDHLLVPFVRAAGGAGYSFDVAAYARKYDLSEAEVELLRGALDRGAVVGDRSTVPIMQGKETVDIQGTGARGRVVVQDIVAYLGRRAARSGQLNVDEGGYGDRAEDLMSETLADEIGYEAGNYGSAAGWYTTEVDHSMNIFSKIFPRVASSRRYRTIFEVLLGATSQGQDIIENAKDATRLLSLYEKYGRIETRPLAGSMGKAAGAIVGNLEKMQRLIDNIGEDKLRELMNRKMSTAEWNKALKTEKYWKGLDMVISGPAELPVTGWFIFGPKIGSYINNLHGDQSTLTADLWFVRTWNRITGRPFHYQPALAAVQYRNFTNELAFASDEQLEQFELTRDQIEGMGYDEAILVADEIHKRFEKGGFKDRTALNRAAKNLINTLTDHHQAPRRDLERVVMDRVVQKTVDKLGDRGINIKKADAQAVAWFYEKRLFQKLGYTSTKGKEFDYIDGAEAAMQMIKGDDVWSDKHRAAAKAAGLELPEIKIPDQKAADRALTQALAARDKLAKDPFAPKKKLLGKQAAPAPAQARTIFPKTKAAPAEKDLEKQVQLSLPAVGLHLRDVGEDFPRSSRRLTLLELGIGMFTKGTPAEDRAIERAVSLFNSWPAQISGVDKSTILIRNPEYDPKDNRFPDDPLKNRVWHMIRDKDSGKIDKVKFQWFAMIPHTLTEAPVRVVNEENGNRIYVNQYQEANHLHAVVVRPDGSVALSKPFDGSLITHVRNAPGKGKILGMKIDFVRGGVGFERRPGALYPASADASLPQEAKTPTAGLTTEESSLAAGQSQEAPKSLSAVKRTVIGERTVFGEIGKHASSVRLNKQTGKWDVEYWRPGYMVDRWINETESFASRKQAEAFARDNAHPAWESIISQAEAPKSLANAGRFSPVPARNDPAGARRLANSWRDRGLNVLRAAKYAIQYWPSGGRPTEDILDAIPQGREYLQRVERAWWGARQRTAKWNHELTKARRDMTGADKEYLRTSFMHDYEIGGADQTWPSPAVEKFARAWASVNEQIGQEAEASGIKILSGGQDGSFRMRDPGTYVPHRLTDEAEDILHKQNGPGWDALVEAAKVNGIDTRVLLELRQDPLKRTRNGSLEYARIADLPWTIEVDGREVQILEKDPSVLFAHIRNAARTLSTVEEFGMDEASADYLNEVANDLVMAGADRKVTPEAIARIWSRLQGRDVENIKDALGKLYPYYNALEATVAGLNLSGAVIGNLIGGHLPESVRMGVTPTFKAFWQAYTTSLKDGGLDQLHNLVDLEGDLLAGLQMTEGIEGGAKKMATKILTGTGFVGANRRINLAVAMAMQRTNMKAMLTAIGTGKDTGKLWGQDAGAARRYLTEELRFSEDDIERMVLEGPTDEDMARAIGKELELVNAMNEAPASRPQFVAHPIWRIGFAYSTFVRKMYDTTKYAAREAKAGNARPMATLLFAGTLTGAMIQAVRNALWDREKEEAGFIERFAELMAQVGALGMISGMGYALGRYEDDRGPDAWKNFVNIPMISTPLKIGAGALESAQQMDLRPLWKSLTYTASAASLVDRTVTRLGLLGRESQAREYADQLANKVYLEDAKERVNKRTLRLFPAHKALDPIPTKERSKQSIKLIKRLRATGMTDDAIVDAIRNARDRRAGIQ